MKITKLATDSGWAFLGKIGALGLGLITNVFLARLMQPAEFGTYFLVISIARVAALTGQVGMNQAVVRYISGALAAGQKEKIGDTTRKAFSIVLLGSCFIGLLYGLFDRFLAESFFANPAMATVSGLVFIWIIATALRILAAECFRGFHDLKLASLFELVAFEFLFAVFILLAWSTKQPLFLEPSIRYSTIAAAISAVAALWLLKTKISSLPIGSGVTYHRLLTTGLPLLISNLVVVIMTQAGLWVVGGIGTPADVALYGAAFRLVMLLQLPLLIFNSVVPQLIADLYVQKKNLELERALRLIAMAELLPTTLAYAIFLFWGAPLLSLLFGQFYAAGHLILILLGSGIMVNAWAGFCGPALMMTGQQHALMKISIICGILTIIAAFALGHNFGPAGVAAAMALGVSGQHILMVLAVKRLLGIWTFAGNLNGLARRIRHGVN